VIARGNEHRGIRGETQRHLRAELDHPEALTSLDYRRYTDPRHDSPCDEPADLRHHARPVWRLEVVRHLVVAVRGGLGHRGLVATGAAALRHDGPRQREPLHVHVPQREEDRDLDHLGLPVVVLHAPHREHTPVRRRQHVTLECMHGALRIAEREPHEAECDHREQRDQR